MWCRICGQDVPGIPSLDGGAYSCDPLRGAGSFHFAGDPRLRRGRLPHPRKTCEDGAASTAAQQPPIYDGWEIDEELRHFRRVLGQAPVRRENSARTAQPKFRLDAGHGVPAPHLKRARRSSQEDRTGSGRSEEACPGRPPAGRAGLDDLVAGHDGLRLRPWP